MGQHGFEWVNFRLSRLRTAGVANEKRLYHGGHGGDTEDTEDTEKSHLFILKNRYRMIHRQHAAAARCVRPGIVEAIARMKSLGLRGFVWVNFRLSCVRTVGTVEE
jgi:hypothetical protein